MKNFLVILVLLFSFSVFGEETNTSPFKLLEIKVNELFIYKDENGYEKIKLNYDLSNKYLKLIKLVDHTLIIKDLLGKTITMFYLERDLYLTPNTQQNFTIDNYRDFFGYAPFRIKTIKFEDLVFEHEVKSIVFENNFILSIDSEN